MVNLERCLNTGKKLPEKEKSPERVSVGIDVQVEDLRDPNIKAKFDLDKFRQDFLIALEIARDPKDFYTKQKELKSFDFGKNFTFASAEGDAMQEIAQNLRGLRIQCFNIQRKMVSNILTRTVVKIFFLLEDSRHASGSMTFDEEGKRVGGVPFIIEQDHDEITGSEKNNELSPKRGENKLEEN